MKRFVFWVASILVLPMIFGSQEQTKIKITTLGQNAFWENFSLSLLGKPGRYEMLHFSSDGRHMAFIVEGGSSDSPLRFFIDGKDVVGQGFSKIFDYEISPDGTRWALIGSKQDEAVFARKKPQYIVMIDGKEERTFETSHQSPVADLKFSPDSRRVAYAVTTSLLKNSSLTVVDGNEGPQHNMAFVEDSMQFSPDSRHLAYFAIDTRGRGLSSGERKILVCDDRELFVLGTRASDTIWFSPGSGYVVAVVWRDTGFGLKPLYKIYDLQEQKEIYDDKEIIGCGFSPDGKIHHVVVPLISKQEKIIFSDGVSATYQRIEGVTYSSDGLRRAVKARKGDKWLVLADGKEGRQYKDIEHVMFSPDGKKIAYAAKNEQNKWVMAVDDVEWGPYDKIVSPAIEVPEGIRIRRSFFSPDGLHVAFAARTGKSYSLVVDGKTVATYPKMGVPVFSPDGLRTAAWVSNGKKEFVVVDGKAMPGFERVDEGQLVFSPDNRHVAYCAKTGKSWSLVVDDTPSSNSFDGLILAHKDNICFVFTSPDTLYYVGVRNRGGYLVEEKIEEVQ